MKRTTTPILQDSKLVWSVVWRFKRKYPKLDKDSLFSEAAIAYIRAVWVHDPAKGKLSTWTVHNMRLALGNYCQRHTVREKYKGDMPNEPRGHPSDFAQIAFRDWLEHQPEDVQAICRIVLDNPGEYAGMPPKLARGKIVQILRELGWVWGRIWDGFRDVKTLFK